MGNRAETFTLKDSYDNNILLEMPFQAVGVTGLAMPPLVHRTVRAPFQHGASFIGFSLQPRPVQFVIHMRGCSRLGMWGRRASMIDLINPLLGSMRIKVDFRDGSIYELWDVVYDAGFDVGTDGQPEPAVQDFPMRLIAYDPVWYKFPELSVGLTFTVVNELVFHEAPPWPAGVGIQFPYVWFGAGGIYDSVNVTTGGNWISYPRIVLTGPMSNPTIINETTNEELILNYSIVAGEVVTIETRFGQKTVTNAGGADLLGRVSTNSDLATFHLDPHPLAAGGVNVMNVIASDCAAGVSEVAFYWYDRYLGL